MEIAIQLLCEAMDKEPAISQVWLTGACLALFGFLLARWRGWLVILTILLSIVLIDGVLDPSVGPAIQREAGVGYVVQAYAAFALCLVANLAGLYSGVRGRRRTLHNPI